MLGKSRLRLLLMLLGAAGAVMGAARPGRAESEQPPNIVLILADDMGWHQLACYGNSFYQTPSVDALAGQGMRFTDAYAAAPVCSPTRASLMTGKYPARLHITDYIPGSPFPFNRLKTPIMAAGLPLEQETIPEMLARAGYVSGHFGKWHLNKDKAYAPGRPGDPRSQGFSDVLTTKKPTEPEGAQAGADPDYDAHHVREITDRSLAFMKANRDRPFFCYVTHNSIHRPIMEFAPSILKYAVKPEASNKMGNNPVIGAMVETLDRSVQRVLDCIDELEMADQTMVIFYSDNGGLFGREGLKPLYGAKADLYEGGVRVPLIVRWPGVVKPGTVSNEPVSTIDFLPTLAKIAGLQVTDPTVDGVSFLPALTESGPLGRDALYWHYPHYHHQGVAPSGSIREGRYKLIEWFEKSRLEGAQADGALLLFDLEADPGERRNLAAAMPDRTRRMYQKLVAWRKNVGAQEMTPNPDHDPEREGFKGAADH